MSPPSAGVSPVSFPMSGHFSDEDIHELLGAMSSHDHASVEHLATLDEETSHEEVVSMPQENPGSYEEGTAETSLCEQQDASENAMSEEDRAQARSERKRSREKQRRSDVNKQFADLTALLRRIESEDLDAEGMAGLASIPLGGPTNRVDLIARTISVLERMHDMSCKKRREVQDLNKQLEDMKKMAEDTAARLKELTAYQQGPPKPVMMMVPMMVSPNMGQHPGATAAPGFAMASPFMQTSQQPAMFLPQMAAMAAAGNPSTMMTQVPQQIQPQQQMPVSSFPQMMFASTAPQPPSAPAPQPSTPQQQGQKQPANVNGGGGNLAHCA